MANADHGALPPEKLTLAADEVHIWQAPLDLDLDVYRRLETTLSPDEQARAARFKFNSGREHFTAGRGILRELLGRYLGQSAKSLGFSYGPQGKPALTEKPDWLPVSFNVSHSHGLALFAFALGREVGVDIEQIRNAYLMDKIAERFFSEREVAELRAIPMENQAEGFFRCWTRKEAYIKARSEGLQISLQSFSVSFTPGARERLESADSARWRVHPVETPPGYAGAVVAEGQVWQLRSRAWAPSDGE